MDNTYVQLKIDTKIRSIKYVKDTRKSVYPMLGGCIQHDMTKSMRLYIYVKGHYMRSVSSSEYIRMNHITLKVKNNI